jgi:uncharacterized ion transporter superfamily protein YfcC
MTHTPKGAKNLSERVPDSYIILFFVVVLAGLFTYIVPAGSFKMIETTDSDTGQSREVIDPDSFELLRNDDGSPKYLNVSLFFGEADLGERDIHRFPSDANGKTGLFNFLFEGLTSGSKYSAAVGVIAFILVIGGSFGVLLRTGAVNSGILWVIHRAGGSGIFVVPVLFVLFSLAGAIFGMSEEAIAFALIVVPLIVALGYDSITGVLVTYVATQVGFATSWMNPFNIGVAQGLANIPVLSGAGFRFIMWIVFTAVALAFVLRYALYVKRNPQRSLSYSTDSFFRNQNKDRPDSELEFNLGHKLVLLIFALGLVWVICGVVFYQYYIPEIATQFFVIGILTGIIGAIFKLDGMGWNSIPESFRKGSGDLLGAAMIVGMAKGVIILLGGDDPTDPSVLNTILHKTGSLIEPFSNIVAAQAMLVFQSLLNFLLPSGSGQAALTIPLMAPLADLTGLSRQIAVLAFQLGDGFTNIIIPTSASLVGTLAVARIDYATWVRFIWKFQLILIVLSAAFIWIAVAINLQ